MNDVRDIDEFIAVLRRARAAVVRGETGCHSSEPEARWCYRCALVNYGSEDGSLFRCWRGPEFDWSFGKTRAEVLALFDASIKDMQRERRAVLKKQPR